MYRVSLLFGGHLSLISCRIQSIPMHQIALPITWQLPNRTGGGNHVLPPRNMKPADATSVGGVTNSKQCAIHSLPYS